MNIKFIIITFIIKFIGEVTNHGFLSDPPARSSAWREDPDLFPINHNDDRMNCGSKRKQWRDNGKMPKNCHLIFYVIDFIPFIYRWKMWNMWRRILW